MKQELIGRKVQIIFNNQEINGEIINETKNMVHLKTKTKIKKYVKNSIKIKIKDKIVNGKNISKRPAERIKAC